MPRPAAVTVPPRPLLARLLPLVGALVLGAAAACSASSSPPSTDQPAAPTGGTTGAASGGASGGASGSPTDAAGAMTLSPSCPAPPAREIRPTVQQLNQLGKAIDLPTWQAGDIGASARLADGRIVWLFGDTLRPNMDPSLVANSMLVTSGECVSQLLDAAKGPVIPDVSENVVRWPMSVVAGGGDDGDPELIAVLCSRIDRGHSGEFGFTFLGTSAAVFAAQPGEAPQLVKVVDITPDSRRADQINWGAAATLSGDWIYVYGTRLTGQKYDVGRELYVARAPRSDPGARHRWRFWDGDGWVAGADAAQAVLPSDGGVSQTLSVDRIGAGFVAVSKRNGDVSDFVYKWTAPDPWGPWRPVEELKAPAGLDTGRYEYAPLAHPEVRLRSGRLLISISRNTNDFQHLLKDPVIGRPVFAALPR
ncbi:DUF4185 domain-containing protein [Nocardioides sp. GY 10113]|uniref:DUF4185 domain-containing protein n=1 Tax=Nocardioides sp. GY 10113 TaxID=2569761 RepID=UPI0010A815CA|nr:DUF4185 domain-containing protein [Nocardioides sp. GY 10113]TIC88265.1 DUF4185 domain-containing protein [Nocardioides sp. GY 10113]